MEYKLGNVHVVAEFTTSSGIWRHVESLLWREGKKEGWRESNRRCGDVS